MGWANHVQQQQSDATKHSNRATEPVYQVGPLRAFRDGTGSVGESLAAIIQEEAFEALDAPIRIVGALDTPVPYSPPLEEAFLPNAEKLCKAARALAGY